jgi:hypothetical protein
MRIFAAFIVTTLLLVSSNAAQCQHDQMHDQHSDHHQQVNERGDKVMGFSHEKTTHHFILLTDGGAIEVSANDATDTQSRDQIRMHLKHITQMFAKGNFNAPMLIHAQPPPGVEVMQQKMAAIDYQFSESQTGGRVRITTKDAAALQAIHDFLRFQIKDHQTGDSLEVRDRL